MPPPSVSLCVPTWNGARYLSAALESALAQTYAEFELLIVDDGSTDGTIEVAASFRDPRIRIHRNDRRLGIPGNWNRSLELARGRYVKFLFQDDLLAPRAVEMLVGALEAVPAAAIAFSHREVRHEGAPPADPPLLGAKYSDAASRFYAAFRGPFDGIDLVRKGLQDGWDLAVNVVGEPSFALLRREAVHRAGGFDPDLGQLVDWDLWLRLAKEAPVVLVPETLGVFRVHPRSRTAANHRSLRTVVECIRILHRIRRHFGPRLTAGERRRLASAECRYVAHLAGEALRSVPRGQGRRAPVIDA